MNKSSCTNFIHGLFAVTSREGITHTTIPGLGNAILRLSVWNQSDGIMSDPWTLSLWFSRFFWCINVQALILWINLLLKIKMFALKWTTVLQYFKLKSRFLSWWRSGSIGRSTIYFPSHSFSSLYDRIVQLVPVGCMKGFQGEICCSVETKEDIASYQVFTILSLFWVSLEHKWETLLGP